jgi:hypothetical protein
MSSEEQVREANEVIPHRLDFGEYGFLQFQKGPRNEVGINGLFIETDVLPALVTHLENLNKVLPSRETSLAITKLQECVMWLNERQRVRSAQNVLGTYKPHSS